METKELKIIPPEGYEIDKEKSTFEKIVFKPINTKPRSWAEYCNNYTGKTFWIEKNSTICDGKNIVWGGLCAGVDKNTLPTKELAEAFLAMMQLMSLRQAWIGEWKPDWSNEYLNKYCIIGICCGFEVLLLNKCRYPLSFPTEEMAKDFMNCFKDLLEIAKPLL